jgi:hypothetical protein
MRSAGVDSFAWAWRLTSHAGIRVDQVRGPETVSSGSHPKYSPPAAHSRSALIRITLNLAPPSRFALVQRVRRHSQPLNIPMLEPTRLNSLERGIPFQILCLLSPPSITIRSYTLFIFRQIGFVVRTQVWGWVSIFTL